MESRPPSGGFCSTTFPQRVQRHLNQRDDREVDSPFVSTSQSCFTPKVNAGGGGRSSVRGVSSDGSGVRSDMKEPAKGPMGYFESVIVPTLRALVMAMFGQKPDAPPESQEHPYRGSEPPKIEPKPAPERPIVVTCVTRNDEGRDKKAIETIKEKTRPRAIRYFRNLERPGAEKEVKHRVTDRSADEIEFAYFRRSGKPMHIRWRKEPYAEVQDQK